MRWSRMIQAVKTTFQVALGFALLVAAEPGAEMVLQGWKWT